MEPITASVGSFILFILLVVSIISIARSSNHGFGGKLLWIIVVIVLPFLGSILWFVFGRGKVSR